MTAPTPTGKLVPSDDGFDLILARNLPCTLNEAWAFVTDPQLTSRWIGSWKGTGAAGEIIQVQMGFEENASWVDVKITECDAPHRLRVLTFSADDPWDLSLELAGTGDSSDLRFVHHGLQPSGVGNIGPGWEFYLDQLAAAITNVAAPNWDDYFPAQKRYFEQQAL